MAYPLISEQVLASAASSVTFSSIPQTYTDLVLEIVNPTSSNSGTTIQFNSDTSYSANYSRTALVGNGTSASSFRNNGSGNPVANHDVGALRPNGTLTAHIMSYANTSVCKTVLTRAGGAANDVWAIVMLWQSTAAISSFIVTQDGGGNFGTGTNFRLWGVA